MALNNLFYCPSCKRVYFLPAGRTYLCTRDCNVNRTSLYYNTSTANQRSRTLSPEKEPWLIPDTIDFSEEYGLKTSLTECKDHGQHPRWDSGSDRDEYMTKAEVIARYSKFVLREVST